MVSPQVLLGLGLGAVLALVGAYVAWLAARLDRLEDQLDADEQSRAGDAHADDREEQRR